jgi:urate oxidase
MLTAHHHGKGQVRVMKVFRNGARHEVRQFLVETNLIGPVDGAFLNSDNSMIVATDTQKNTVFILAKQLTERTKSAEAFAKIIATHFVSTYPNAIHECKVNVEEETWNRIHIDGQPHNHGFQKAGPNVGTAHCHVKRSLPGGRGNVVVAKLTGGVKNLTLLKTTQSSFANFVRDRYTALPESNERLLATSVDSSWEYLPGATENCGDFEAVTSRIRKEMVKAFSGPVQTGVPSASLQETAFQMGKAVINQVSEVGSITLYLPNIHNIPVDMAPFRLENKDYTGNPDVFWVTKEPFGIIQATVSRSGSQNLKSRL